MRDIAFRPFLVALPLNQLVETGTASWHCLLCHTIQASHYPRRHGLDHLRDVHSCVPVTPVTAL
jgi:hypothetical protein